MSKAALKISNHLTSKWLSNDLRLNGTARMLRLSAIFLFIASTAIGQQSIDLIRLDHRFSPSKDTAGKSIAFHRTSFDLKIPIALDSAKKDVIYSNIVYHQNVFVEGSNSVSFQNIRLVAGHVHTYRSGWKHQILAIGTLSAQRSFSLGSSKQIGAIALFKNESNLDRIWTFGMYVNREFFGTLVVPIVGYNIKFNDKWRLNAFMPISAKLSYTASQRLTLGAQFYSFQTSYLAQSSTYLHASDQNLWMFSDLYLSDTFVLHFRVGHAVARTFKNYRESEQTDVRLMFLDIGPERPKTTNFLKDGLSFQAGLVFRLPTN